MKIIYQQHIAWFETEMALKTLHSVQKDIENTNLEVQIKLFFNCQTTFDILIRNYFILFYRKYILFDCSRSNCLLAVQEE